LTDAEVVDQLRSVHHRAMERRLQWAIDDTALWLHVLHEPIAAKKLSPPFEDHCRGRWREAALGWRDLGHAFEQALALSEGSEDAQREALAIFDRLGAAPAAARLRRLMRAAGVRAIPRGPNFGTRANPAGLTQRQTQVLELLGEGLSNPEIADRLCISAKTAEHHVSAIMARLDVATRREATAAARKLGLLDPHRT
jgi:DNA-binding CsgD family transcriptional regulator